LHGTPPFVVAAVTTITASGGRTASIWPDGLHWQLLSASKLASACTKWDEPSVWRQW